MTATDDSRQNAEKQYKGKHLCCFFTLLSHTATTGVILDVHIIDVKVTIFELCKPFSYFKPISYTPQMYRATSAAD